MNRFLVLLLCGSLLHRAGAYLEGNTAMNSFRLGLAIFMALALANLPVCEGQEASDMENAKVLQKLVDYDSIFMSGFTVSCTLEGDEKIAKRAPLLKGVKRRWSLTFGGDRVAYRAAMIAYPKPKYEDLEGSETEIDDKQTRAVAIRTRQWGYWGDDVSGTHYEDTELRLLPTGEIEEKGTNRDSLLFGPTAAGPIVPKRYILWSLGRFFSKQLDKVTRVEKGPDGRLVVSALGEQSPGYKGRWELEIEPAAAWMVRAARFYWDEDPKRMRAEMKNDGTVWSGPHCIPKEAACNYWGSLDSGIHGAVQITFEPVVEPFDEKLYGDARQAVVDNKTPELTIMDHRVSPIRSYEPNKPEPEHTPPTPASLGMMWFVVVNVVVCVSVLVFYLLWKRQTNKAPGRP